MLNFASFIKTIKPFADNIGISDEDFVSGLIDYVSAELKIVVKNKKGDNTYYITKSKISLLLNQKKDISSTIRAPFCKPSAKQALMKALPQFFDDYLNSSRLIAMEQALKDLVQRDYSLDADAKSRYLALQGVELFAVVFIESIKANNLKVQKTKELWRSGNNSISLIPGDLIKIAFENTLTERRIVVIPVNTAFDTQLSTNAEDDLFPLVSEKTIHGQWLTRILKVIDKNELDCRIQKYLCTSGATPIGTSRGIGGKADKYSIGTTVAIQEKSTIYYLLAVSDFDDRNVARSSKDLIKKAIEKLLDYYDELGLGYEIYIPLLGTGKSRAHLTPKESMQLIKDTLVEQRLKINGHIYIVAFEDTILELS